MYLRYLTVLFNSYRRDTSSELEEDITPTIFPEYKKKTPRKLHAYLKSGHVRGKSDATLQKFLVPAAPGTSRYQDAIC